MSEGAVARSPIAQIGPTEILEGWVVSRKKSSAALRLADLSQLTKIGVKAHIPPFDIPYGRSARDRRLDRRRLGTRMNGPSSAR